LVWCVYNNKPMVGREAICTNQRRDKWLSSAAFCFHFLPIALTF
jgi:hypothetical protein